MNTKKGSQSATFFDGGDEEKNMCGMTNEQFNAVLKLIIQILKDDNVSENTIKKIESLLK